jgi:hypothetical protein
MFLGIRRLSHRAWPREAKREAKNRGWQKMIVHGHGGQPRPEAAVRQASVEAGDRADARLRQRGRQRAQVVWTDGHVTVGRDNDRVASDTRHIDEVGDLAVAAMRGGVDDQPEYRARDIAQSAI